jgi:CRP-like cAMP-binding protein
MGTLQRCDYFGMRSLLSDEPRAYDVLATTPVVLAKIERKTLIEITGPLTELVEMSFTREVLTTARAQRAAPVPPHASAHHGAPTSPHRC